MAQPVRAKTLLGWGTLQFEQVAQPVADGAAVDRAAPFVTKKRLGRRHFRPDVVDEPAQHQVQLVEHRDPAWPGARAAGAFAEADVDLPEGAPAEMQVDELQRGGLVCSQPGVIERPEEGVVPACGPELAGCGDPVAQEGEELLHPLR
jgi:hypothetical protein